MIAGCPLTLSEGGMFKKTSNYTLAAGKRSQCKIVGNAATKTRRCALFSATSSLTLPLQLFSSPFNCGGVCSLAHACDKDTSASPFFMFPRSAALHNNLCTNTNELPEMMSRSQGRALGKAPKHRVHNGGCF
jgi:hypothetical protein